MTEYVIYALPYLLGITLILGFLGALAVGCSLGMGLIFLHSTMNALSKFHALMAQVQKDFEKMHASVQEQASAQARISEVWKRTRQEQREEQAEQKAVPYPAEYKQSWRRPQADSTTPQG